MAAYRDALAVIFPGRRVEGALLYTAAPRLIVLGDALLDAHKPGLRATKANLPGSARSEEHTSELQSLMRISYAVFCLKKKNTSYNKTHHTMPLHLNHTDIV